MNQQPLAADIGQLAAPTFLLESIVGNTCQQPGSVAAHPFLPIVAYTAGASVVLFHTDTFKVHSILNASTALAGQPLDAKREGEVQPLLQFSPSTNILLSTKCIAWSPDGIYLATGNRPRVLVWDWERQLILSVLKGHRYGIVGLCFSPKSRHLVTLGDPNDGYMYVWHWRTGARPAYFKSREQMEVLSSSYRGDLFVIGGKKFLRYWRFDDDDDLLFPNSSLRKQANMTIHAGEEFTVTKNFEEDIMSLTAEFGSKIFALTAKKRLLIFRNFALTHWIDLDPSALHYCICASRKFISLSSSNGHVSIFDALSFEHISTIPSLSEHTGPEPGDCFIVHDLSRNDNVADHKIMCIYAKGKIGIWDVSALPEAKLVYKSNSQPSKAVQLKSIRYPKEDKLVVVSDEGLTFWPVISKSAGVLDAARLTKAAIRNSQCVRILENKAKALCGTYDGFIKVISTTSLEVEIEQHLGFPITAMDIFEGVDKILIACGGTHRNIVIVELRLQEQTLNVIQTLSGHSAAVVGLKLICNEMLEEKDELLIVSASVDKSVLFFKARLQAKYLEFNRMGLVYINSTITSIDLDVTHVYLAIASDDGVISIIDTTSMSIEQQIPVRTLKPKSPASRLAQSKLNEPSRFRMQLKFDLSGIFIMVACGTPKDKSRVYDNVILLVHMFTGKIYDSSSSSLVQHLSGGHHCSKVVDLCWIKPRHLISIDNDGLLHVWRIINARVVAEIENRYSALKECFQLRSYDQTSPKEKTTDDTRLPSWARMKLGQQSKGTSSRLKSPQGKWRNRLPEDGRLIINYDAEWLKEAGVLMSPPSLHWDGGLIKHRWRTYSLQKQTGDSEADEEGQESEEDELNMSCESIHLVAQVPVVVETQMIFDPQLIIKSPKEEDLVKPEPILRNNDKKPEELNQTDLPEDELESTSSKLNLSQIAMEEIEVSEITFAQTETVKSPTDTYAETLRIRRQNRGQAFERDREAVLSQIRELGPVHIDRPADTPYAEPVVAEVSVPKKVPTEPPAANLSARELRRLNKPIASGSGPTERVPDDLETRVEVARHAMDKLMHQASSLSVEERATIEFFFNDLQQRLSGSTTK